MKKKFELNKSNLIKTVGAVVVACVALTGAVKLYPKTVNPNNQTEIVNYDTEKVVIEDAEAPKADAPVTIEEFNGVNTGEEIVGEEKQAIEEAMKEEGVPTVPNGYKATVSKSGTETLVPTKTPATPSANTGAVSQKKYVTVYIGCTGIMDVATDSLKERIPNGGVLLDMCEVEFVDGESVWDVFERLAAVKGVPYRYVNSIFGVYIPSIDNLAEFGGGLSSGWCYYVNGAMPSYSCDSILVNEGDVIRWEYDDWDLSSWE